MFDVIIGRSDKDKERLGTKGAILLGKHFVKMGRVTSLSNPVYLDMTRSHVVFVCGKRGGGKCLSGDTLITLGDGSLRRIDELAHDDREVMALAGDLKIRREEKEGFYEREVDRVLRVTTRTGKSVTLTPEHPLLTLHGWVEAARLKKGSRIATPRVQGVFGEQHLPEEQTKLLAYLIAEGHLRNGFVLFSNADPLINDDFSSALRAFDTRLRTKQHGPHNLRVVEPERRAIIDIKERDERGRIVAITRDKKHSLRVWLEGLGLYGKKAEERSVPQAVFTLPKNGVSLFLNRLFSCDGSIHKDKNRWRASYASTSIVLIRQVQHLLLRFGVVSTLREKKTRSPLGRAYEIIIQGSFLKTFLEEVGLYGHKEERQAVALRELERTKHNPNLDTIPQEVWSSIVPESWAAIGRAAGYAHPKAYRESVRYSPSRQKLLQVAIVTGDEVLKALATSDVYWDEVVAIEEVFEKTKVYDFTVPESHNFVANDIIVHNSYTMGVIAEGMADMPREIKENISVIMLDTMGIYWTMKYPNKKDNDLLQEWGLQGKGLDIKIYTPTGYYDEYKEKGIPTDYPFSIKPSELAASEWLMTFGIEESEPVGVLIERVIHRLSEERRDEYGLEDIERSLMEDEDADHNTRLAAKNRFSNAKSWGLFDREGTPLSSLAKGGQITVLDVSCYATMPGSWNVKNLVIGLVAQKLFIQRMVARKDEEFHDLHKAINPYSDDSSDEQDYPLVWLVIDEAHEFLPVEGKTLATDPLVTILREGRQPGISLVLATQQPGKIHTDVMTQSDTVISHRITAKLDTEALGMLMQSYMRKGLTEELDQLPRLKGAAIIFDDTNERMYPIRVRPRFTWHGGEAPSALKEGREDFRL
jgi:uncharacterized protein